MDEELFAALEPAVRGVDLELFDVELRSGVLLVTVDRDGGVDLEALTEANRAVSAVLDELDPIPGRYTLEVSSPGVERTLRTPAHFAKAVGETVSVKTRPQVPGDRRRKGRLTAADPEGVTLEVEGDGPDAGPSLVHLGYSDIDKARTVFEWGPAPRPGGAAGGRTPRAPASKTTGKAKTGKAKTGKAKASGTSQATGQDRADKNAPRTQATEKRKQVVTP
jgi:ribosome maturation factor RimP